jgi:TRAP-type mannitol/chloroaromatic compound transport system substrate-binding protein
VIAEKLCTELISRVGEGRGKASGEAVAELAAKDPFTRRVYESYMKFREASIAWNDISGRAYLNARALDFPYGT